MYEHATKYAFAVFRPVKCTVRQITMKVHVHYLPNNKNLFSSIQHQFTIRHNHLTRPKVTVTA